MSGDVIMPLFIDPVYTVDIDTLLDWQRAESSIMEGRLKIVMPAQGKRPFPAGPRLLILDFDGVMTDDRVWVDQDGREMVAASRADGLGLERLRQLTGRAGAGDVQRNQPGGGGALRQTQAGCAAERE